ncbi:gp27 [Streptococcus pneumoniae]|nr:gp27 [Streptococcus pneumoniae]
MKRFIAIWILLSAGLNIWQMDKIRNLEEKKPMIIYKADNQGAEIKGKVVEKGRHGKLYTLTIRDYGVFVVTEEQYNNVKVGDEVRL